jgi:hypothetical protein
LITPIVLPVLTLCTAFDYPIVLSVQGKTI